MSEKFIDPYENERAIEKMMDLEYRGDMEKYIREMENLNAGPNLSGIMWQKVVRSGLSNEIKDAMAMLGGYTDDDQEMLANLRKAGRRVEERARERKRDAQKSSSGGNKGKGHQDDKSGGQSREQQRPKDSNTQRSKGNSGSKPAPKDNANADSGRKEKRHTDANVALKGISEETRESRKSRRACLRCGENGHGWYHCLKDKKTTDPKTAAAGAKPSKRKASEAQDEGSSEPKKPKVSVVSAGRSFADRLSWAKKAENSKGRFEELGGE